jgi:hypothetical protein
LKGFSFLRGLEWGEGKKNKRSAFAGIIRITRAGSTIKKAHNQAQAI